MKRVSVETHSGRGQFNHPLPEIFSRVENFDLPSRGGLKIYSACLVMGWPFGTTKLATALIGTLPMLMPS